MAFIESVYILYRYMEGANGTCAVMVPKNGVWMVVVGCPVRCIG